MRKSIVYYLFFICMIGTISSCQTSDSQANATEMTLNPNALAGTTWRVQNTQINSQNADVFSFQNQVEIKFLAGGKGTVSYLNKELGADSAFEWEVKDANSTVVIRENQKITVLQVLAFQKDNFVYSFVQGGRAYQFNLKGI